MALKKSVAVLIQARLNSQRLPEKIIKKINNKTIIQLIHERLSFCKEINDIIVVTTKDKKDDKLVKYLSKKKFKFFRGNNENCLNRYFYAAKKYNNLKNNLLRKKLIDWNKWLKGKKLQPIDVCVSNAILNKKINKIVVGFDNYLQFKRYLKIKIRKNDISFFNTDDKKIINPSLWH